MPFVKFPLRPELLKSVKELGFTRPTPIQEKAIAPIAEGRDVLACAMTGSGKTAAFLLPILQRIIDKPRRATKVLVLTPTRELAAQVHAHLEELAVHTPVTGAPIFGGVGFGPQEHALRSGVDIVVATPGRLLDHLRHPYAKLDKLEILVLDEADRMLDMGFLPDIRRILRYLPERRQTLLFSATIPAEIQRLADDMLYNPFKIDLGRKAAPATGIQQAVYPVGKDLKSALLYELLAQKIVDDAIVFTRTKHRANRLAEYLEKRGLPTARIHGNRSQAQRTAALDAFKSGEVRVLVATDIVARGIDVAELGHVVNFDVPEDPDAYVHRVGRTARAERTGSAFTFISPEDETDLRAIEKAIGQRLPRVTLPGFDYTRRAEERLEIPIAERLAAHRAQRAVGRAKQASRAGGAGAPQGTKPASRGGRQGAGRPAASRPGQDARGTGGRPPRGTGASPGSRPGARPGRPKPRTAEERFARILERYDGAARPAAAGSGHGGGAKPTTERPAGAARPSAPARPAGPPRPASSSGPRPPRPGKPRRRFGR